MFEIDFFSLVYGICAGVIMATVVLIGAIAIDEWRNERNK